MSHALDTWGKQRRPHVHATDTTGHTCAMLVTAAVFHSEIAAPYAVVVGFQNQSVTAALKFSSVMAVAEAGTHATCEVHAGYAVCSVVPHDE